MRRSLTPACRLRWIIWVTVAVGTGAISSGQVSRETKTIFSAEVAAIGFARSGNPAGVIRNLSPWTSHPETAHRAARLMAELEPAMGEIPSDGLNAKTRRLIDFHRRLISAESGTPELLIHLADSEPDLFYWDYELARQTNAATTVRLQSLLSRLGRSEDPFVVLARIWVKDATAIHQLSLPGPAASIRAMDALAIRADILLQQEELTSAQRIARIVSSRAEADGDSWRAGEGEILLAQIALSMNDHPMAERHLRRAENQAKRFPLPSLQRRRDCVAAMLRVRQGRLEEAEGLFRSAIAPNSGRQDRIHAAAMVNLGFVLDERGRSAEALRCYGQALIFYQTRGDTAGVALVRLNRGAVWERLNLLNEARDEYEAVLRTSAPSLDASLCALAQGNLGNIYARRRHWDAAVRYYQAALETAERLAEWSRAAQIAGNLAIVQLARRDMDAAETAWRTARRMHHRQPTPLGRFLIRSVTAHIHLERSEWTAAEREFGALAREIQAAGLHSLAWEMCYFHGRALAGQGRHEDALACFRQAIQGFERVERDCGNTLIQLHFLENCDEVVEASLASLVVLAKDHAQPDRITTEAFHLIETYRTRVLVREMADARPTVMTAPGKTTLPAVMSWLKRRSAFAITLFQGVEAVYRLHMSGACARLERIAATGEFCENVAAAAGDGPVSSLARRRLAGMVFGNFPSPELLAARELFILPDGALYHLPVELLPVSAAPGRVLPSGELWPVLYLPGWRFLSVQGESPGNRMARTGFLGVHGFPEAAAGWSGLPWAEREVRGAAEQLQWPRTRLVPGAALTHREIRKGFFGQGWDVIHVATHIEANETMPWNSRIHLGATGTRTLSVTLSDLQAMQWQANLVVLSGCSSGRGRVFPGDGNMTLGRALLVSGSRAVLLTLWPVLDRSAATFMERFYRELPQHSGDVAMALRSTRRWMRRDPAFQHPRHWAAFVLFGLPQPVRARSAGERRDEAVYWALLGAMALALGVRIARSGFDR